MIKTRDVTKPTDPRQTLVNYFDGHRDHQTVTATMTLLARFYDKSEFNEEDVAEIKALISEIQDKAKLIEDVLSLEANKPSLCHHYIDDYFEHDDAIKVVKKNYHKGLHYYIRAGNFIYTELATEDKNARGYESSALIDVSQAQVFKYITSMVGGEIWKERKVKIHIVKNENSFFIG